MNLCHFMWIEPLRLWLKMWITTAAQLLDVVFTLDVRHHEIKAIERVARKTRKVLTFAQVT